MTLALGHAGCRLVGAGAGAPMCAGHGVTALEGHGDDPAGAVVEADVPAKNTFQEEYWHFAGGALESLGSQAKGAKPLRGVLGLAASRGSRARRRGSRGGGRHALYRLSCVWLVL